MCPPTRQTRRISLKIHSEELDVVTAVDVSCRFTQHWLGHIDTCDAAVIGIERSRKAGADPDLENLVPWLQRELMHRLAPSRLQDWATQPVIDRRTL